MSDLSREDTEQLIALSDGDRWFVTQKMRDVVNKLHCNYFRLVQETKSKIGSLEKALAHRDEEVAELSFSLNDTRDELKKLEKTNIYFSNTLESIRAKGGDLLGQLSQLLKIGPTE